MTNSGEPRPAVSVGWDDSRPGGIGVEIAAVTDPPTPAGLHQLNRALSEEVIELMTLLAQPCIHHPRTVLLARLGEVFEDITVATAAHIAVHRRKDFGEVTALATLTRLLRHLAHAERARAAGTPRTPMVTAAGRPAWPELDTLGGAALARALDTITGADPTRLPAAYLALAETCRRVFDHPVLLVLNGLGRTPA